MDGAPEPSHLPRKMPTEVVVRFSDLIVGSVFIATGLAHLSNPYSFLATVLGYKVGPSVLAVVVAATLPLLECITGTALVSGYLRDGSRTIVVGLLTVFVLAQASAAIRGLEISCGCYGIIGDMAVGWKSIGLSATLLVLSLMSFLK